MILLTRNKALKKLSQLKKITNPSDKNKEDFTQIDKFLRETFKKLEYKIGDKIIINDNRCSSMCQCYYGEHSKFTIDTSKIYTIKNIHYFGGGCPSELLEIEELPNTHSSHSSLPANWFEPIKNRTL